MEPIISNTEVMTMPRISTVSANATRVDVFRGEIVQIWDNNISRYAWNMPQGLLRDIKEIKAEEKLQAVQPFPAPSNDTVQAVLQLWFSRQEGVCLDKVVKTFGLKKYLEVVIKDASPELVFRLQTIHALLTGAQILVFTGSGGVRHFTELIVAARAFAATHKAGTEPAFVVLDEGETVGISMVADRILEIQEGEMKELLLDF